MPSEIEIKCLKCGTAWNAPVIGCPVCPGPEPVPAPVPSGEEHDCPNSQPTPVEQCTHPSCYPIRSVEEEEASKYADQQATLYGWSWGATNNAYLAGLKAERERGAAEIAELEERVVSQARALKECYAEKKQLQAHAKFGLDCYQDQCENAYVEQSVADRLRKELTAAESLAGKYLSALEEAMDLLDYASFDHRHVCNWDAAVPNCTCGAWKMEERKNELLSGWEALGGKEK